MKSVHLEQIKSEQELVHSLAAYLLHNRTIDINIIDLSD